MTPSCFCDSFCIKLRFLERSIPKILFFLSRKSDHYHIFVLNINTVNFPSLLQFSRPAFPRLLHFSEIFHSFTYTLLEQHPKLLCCGFGEVLVKYSNVITSLCVPFLATHSESLLPLLPKHTPPDPLHLSESLSQFTALLIPM